MSLILAYAANAISLELGDLFAQFRISGLSERKASGCGVSFREVATRVAVGSPRYTARRCRVASERLRWPRRLRPARSRQEHPIGGTSDPGWTPIEHVRVVLPRIGGEALAKYLASRATAPADVALFVTVAGRPITYRAVTRAVRRV